VQLKYGQTGLVATYLTPMCEEQGSIAVVLLAEVIATYSHGHTLITVPRLTQPATLRGMVN